MDFYQKYELLDLLKDEGVKVFNAREIATGRQITMFLFVGEQARLHADLLEQLRASQRPGRPDLLEVGDNQGTPYAATEPLGGLADLKRMAAAAQAPPAPRAGRPPDAFTRVGVWHIPAPTPSGAQGATPVTPPPPPHSAAAGGTAAHRQAAPGEFTRMFQAPAAPQPMGEAAPPAPLPRHHAGRARRVHAAVPGAAPQPMVRPLHRRQDPHRALRRRHRQPRPASSRECSRRPRRLTWRGRSTGGKTASGVRRRRHRQPRPASSRGSFSLRSRQAPAPEPVFPPPPAAPTGAAAGSSAPGEFTRIFGRGDLPAAQAAPPAGAGATQSFHARPEFTPPATPAPSAGPGEYTRMFSAQPVVQPAPPAPPAPAAAPIAAKKVPWLTLALIVAVVVLLAVVAIMAFALRK